MKLHRFIGDYNVDQNNIEILNPENIKQIKGILRLKIGENLILSDGKGSSAEVEIVEILKNKIITRIVKKNNSHSIDNKVILYLAILKKENFEMAVQKAVECGVSEIVPIITKRTVKTGINIQRLQKIIMEASEQSGRDFVPAIHEVLSFQEALEKAESHDRRIIFDINMKPDIDLNDKFKGDTGIFIGPEGGFDPSEVAFAQSSGFKTASLGNLTLRGETAAIVATYLTVNNL